MSSPPPADPSSSVATTAVVETVGLSEEEASRRLANDGPNSVEETPTPLWKQIAAKFWGPVPWMLELVVVIQLALDRGIEALIIFTLLLFNGGVAFVQEHRAQDALALLKKTLHVESRVLRDGRWRTLPAEQLVKGDVVHVRAGDLIPADLELLEGQVSLDQAALTGESLPVEAATGKPAYAGSIVQRGEATGRVTATGPRTYFGRTAELVRTSSPPSHMQRTILSIVRWLLALDLTLALLVTVFALTHAMPWTETVLFTLMLLVVSVPVALPATYTLSTALGSMRLAHRGILVTRLPAIEEAASMDTLVSDKTGTLTQNRLQLSAVAPWTSATDEDTLRAAALASDPATQDPIDLAILAKAKEQGLLDGAPPRQAFSPFDPSNRRSEGRYVIEGKPWIAVKGASEAIAPLCRLTDEEASTLQRKETELAAQGARVLAVAAGREDALSLVGLVGLSDPIRPEAPMILRRLAELGIRVRMATGDALETARAIGRRLGLGAHVCRVIDDDLKQIEKCDLFARVLPTEKHAIVQTLQRAGHVTGMTGDGVNDAPALRQAELGIAVSTATDVAKAAAGVVLTEPGLSGILGVVVEGRTIHRRMLTYTLNKILRVIVIVGFLTAGLLVSGRFLVTPTMIVLMIFANDFASMSIASDRVEPTAIPQRWQVRRLMAAALVLALVTLALTVVVYVAAIAAGLGPARLQTVVFLDFVFVNQATLYALRVDGPWWRIPPSRTLWVTTILDIVGTALLARAGILMAPVAAGIILALVGVSFLTLLVLDASKRLVFRWFAIA